MEKIRQAVSMLTHVCPSHVCPSHVYPPHGRGHPPHARAGMPLMLHPMQRPVQCATSPTARYHALVRNTGIRKGTGTGTAVAPNFAYKGSGSLRAAICVASIKPSPRLMKCLLFDDLFRDVKLGEHYDSHEAARALKAMALTAEATLALLENKRGLEEPHYDLLASLNRCRTVIGALDHHHGFSKRSKHSSRRLLMERTLGALQAIQQRYESTQRLLTEAYDTLPNHDRRPGDLETLLHADTVIPLMQTCAGQTKQAQQRLALQETYLMSLIRRGRSDYEDTSHRL